MSGRKFSGSVHAGSRVIAAAAVALSLQACDRRQQADSAIYHDVAECIADNIFSPQYCADSFRAAAAEHAKLAPRYESKDDCEEDWGDDNKNGCEQGTDDQTRRHHYSPVMGGYWAGNNYHYNQGLSSSDPNYATPARREPFSHPVYKGSDGLASPMTNQSFGNYGRVSPFTQADTAMARSVSATTRPAFSAGTSFAKGGTGTIARGGLGASGHGFGSGS